MEVESFWLSMETLMNLTNSTAVKCPPNATAAMHSAWIFHAFGECVENLRQYFAFFIGLSSIVFWLLAQAPQLVTNCRYGKADKALSFWFLLQWFAGDATNLAGAFLTHQLATQVVTAVYFVLIDTVMMGQFLYYVVRNQGVKGLAKCVQCPRKSGAALVLLPGLVLTLLWSLGPSAGLGAGPPHLVHVTGRSLLHTAPTRPPIINIHDTKEFIGYILGCISAALYVGSRLPQIIKNFVRCSVDGLSLPMFILAVLGNVTYALGIFLYSTDVNFIVPTLPWIIGSVGTLIFDFTIFFQFMVIRCCGCKPCGRAKTRSSKEEEGEEEERKPLLDSAASKYEGAWCPTRRGHIQTPDNQGSDKKGSISSYALPGGS